MQRCKPIYRSIFEVEWVAIVCDKIWCDLFYREFFVLTTIYPGFFLMYAVSSFGEELCNAVHLQNINVMR